ncbi:MAG: hypothetical protein KGL39_26625 [Patescibacteria group bacterium]|nr:hypothetical protein [Patescibacteria group bacterium]
MSDEVNDNRGYAPAAETAETAIAAQADSVGPRELLEDLDAPAPPAKKAAKGGQAKAKAPAKAAVAKAPARGAKPDQKRAPAKRGPGRPPKKPQAPALEFKGIVPGPQDVENMFEFATGTPESFKKFFAYLKNLKARALYFRFRKTRLLIFTRDHDQISRIIGIAHGARANWYYCENDFDLVLNRNNVEKMFSSINKDYFKLSIVVKKDDPHKIRITLKDAESGKENNYSFGASAEEPDIDLYDAETEIEANAEDFPVQFTLSAKRFKNDINDAVGYSEVLTYEKLGAEPLQLTYVNTGMVMDQAGVYREPDKISLHSDVKDDQIFRCAVKVSNLKSLATSMVADRVRIMLRETGDILFVSLFDDEAATKPRPGNDKKDVLGVYTLTKTL